MSNPSKKSLSPARADIPSRKPSTDPSSTAELLHDAAFRSIRYLESLDTRHVAPKPEAIAALHRFEEPLPINPGSPTETLDLLDEFGSPATMGMAGSRFFGFVTGGALPVTVATNWLTTAWDQLAALFTTTPATSVIEEVALRWLVDLLGLPPETGGAFVTGCTVANITALAAARNHVLNRVGWNIEANGLFGAPPITVVVSAEAHPSLFKSLGILGLGRERVVTLPTDGQGRIRAEAIPKLAEPAIVCVQAGNINTGAVDPMDTIIDAAHAAGAWVHVDGAFGLWAQAAPNRRYLTRGIERADSWATDAHKWLNVPYDSGITLVRNVHALRAAMAVTAAYLPKETPRRNPFDYTPELSRRARGVDVWAALRTLGRTGIAQMIEQTCRHAKHFAKALTAAGYRVLNEVVLNQVLVSFGEPELTNRVIASLQRDGICWCGGTVWQRQTAMRVSVSSWATTDADVEKSLSAMLRIAHEEEMK